MAFSLDEIDAMYPRFYQLIGGYFHQDWYEEYGGSMEAALDDYVAALDPIKLEKTASEMDTLLLKSSDAELAHILDKLDNNYLYEEDGRYTARAWLELIRNRLRRG